MGEASPPGRERTALNAVQILELEVVDTHGAAVHGELTYRAQHRPPPAADLLLASGSTGPQATVETRPLSGRARIELPAGTWLSLRVTEPDRQRRTAYRLFAPFAGTNRHRMVLDSARRSITAWLLPSDMSAPLPGAEVALFETKLDAVAPPAEIRRARTDEHGICRFEDLPASGFLVCALPAKPGDAAPHVHRLILAPQQPLLDAWCTLVAPAARHDLELLVEVEPGTPLDQGSRLFLQRDEPLEGQLIPVPGGLAAGSRRVALRLPAGSYRLAALPLTEFELVPELVRFVVPASGLTPRVRVRGQPSRVTVRLRGAVDRPANVHARVAGVPISGDPELLYLGPHQWVAETIEVGSSAQPLVVTAKSRSGVWIARSDLRLAPPEQSIDLSPGTRLELRWCGSEAMKARDVTFEVSHGDRTELLIPNRSLVRGDGPDEPAWQASLIVARGRAAVVARAAGAVEPVWSREIDCDRPSVIMHVDGPR
jgi:hypothetical protein